MGLFDTLIEDCPYCGREIRVQTKWTAMPSCIELSFGCEFDSRFISAMIDDGDVCEFCQGALAIAVKDGLFTGFHKIEGKGETDETRTLHD